MERYWFKNRKFGIGWSPATWEGWLCVGLFVLWAVGVTIRFKKLELSESTVLEQLIFPIFFGVFVLIVITIKTGEPLWGNGARLDKDISEQSDRNNLSSG